MSDAIALAARVAELEARLRRLESMEAIRQLKARYAELADARYRLDGPRPPEALAPLADALAALFTEDAVWDGGRALGLCEGREAIRERFLRPTLRFSWHYFVKPRIEVEGDTARARWDVFSPCTAADGTPHWMAGVEDDAYRCVDGVWLHTRMKLEPVFFAPFDRGWGRAPG